MLQNQEWESFKGRLWKEECNVRDFIQNNFTQYNGDESFLEGPTDATNKLWDKLQALQKAERDNGGVLKEDADVVSSITSYGPGYIDPETKDLEQIVGLQTDEPLKRAFMPYGGIKMAEEALEMYGYKPNENFHKIFTDYHKTHNQAVFDAYTPEMMAARHTHIVTGLPDTYGRGRIVGDYRRVALYGIDQLIAWKQEDKANCGDGNMYDDIIRQREELTEQIRRLQEMKVMAQSYGYDISKPASNAKEAVQWLYFGYLAAIKTQNGAAMSVGRVSVHLECFLSHLDTTIRHKCSLKWLVCLKTYDLLKILCLWINVTRTICCNAGYNICVLLQYTTVVSLCLLKSLKLIPELVRSICWSCKEALVSIIRCVVVLDEVSYVALFLPESTCE